MSGGKRGVVGEFGLNVREVECGRIGSGVVRVGWVGLVGRETVVAGLALRWSERWCSDIPGEEQKERGTMGEGHRALEDVKGRGVVIVVDGVRGVSESAGLTFWCVPFRVCEPCSALRCRCAFLITPFFGDATTSMHSSTWMYDSET